jgi:hypothetical protein
MVSPPRASGSPLFIFHLAPTRVQQREGILQQIFFGDDLLDVPRAGRVGAGPYTRQLDRNNAI